jgi:allantoin racemase
MRNILIINPNTTASVSALLQQHGQAIAGADARLRVVTARFGAPYISCEASYAIAGHAALDAWAQASASEAALPDAVLIGCFGDPGLFALREASSVPVTGLAEAAMTEAARHGRFAIVTGGERWKPMLERLAQSLGFGDTLGGILTVAPAGAQLAQDPVAARALLAQACQQAAKDFNANAIVLGGAGLAGLAAHIAPLVNVPVIDSVSAGVRQALLLAGQAPAPYTSRFEEIKPWLGMH